MFRKTVQALFALAFAVACVQYGQPTASAQDAGAKHTTVIHNAGKMSDAQKIALAMSAGPAEISSKAAIMDMTDMSVPPKQLRAGTNGWICYAMVQQPMCLDKEWQKWAAAWMSKGPLKVEGTGVAYMLRGDHGASNTDPFATAPTADNQWV